MSEYRRRLLSCVTNWPECYSGDYDPRCCRFPKSCSCTSYRDGVTDDHLEPAPSEQAASEKGLVSGWLGNRALAEERATLAATELLADAMAASGATRTGLALLSGLSRKRVKRIMRGAGHLNQRELGWLLSVMGFRAELALVPIPDSDPQS